MVDGRRIASSIKKAVKEIVSKQASKPCLGILTCDPNLETRTYLELKQVVAKKLGIKIEVVELNKQVSTEEVIHELRLLADRSSGVIIQLPLPSSIDIQKVFLALPKNKDVDAFNYQGEETEVLPPVVGAIDVISNEYRVTWSGKRVVIFGAGKLVGAPVYHYAKSLGAEVTAFTDKSDQADIKEVLASADIVVLGAGKPNLLTKDQVKEGVVVFDAGASEDGGLLVGDAHPDVAHKASLFTPVPGGIGPITVAILFRNLLKLHENQ